MYEWSELLKLWEVERLTSEQAIGQLMKYGEAHQRHLTDLHRRLERLEAAFASFAARQPPIAGGQTPRPVS